MVKGMGHPSTGSGQVGHGAEGKSPLGPPFKKGGIGRLCGNYVCWKRPMVNPVSPRTYISPPLAGGDKGEGDIIY
jgi:hypothetical protein